MKVKQKAGVLRINLVQKITLKLISRRGSNSEKTLH